MRIQSALAVLIAGAALLGAPGRGTAQEQDVARRSFPFLEDRLVVQVATGAPGVLRVVRGQRGRVEVAGRSSEGVVDFGLGGQITRFLRLSAVGTQRVEYLVVVPEHVRVTVSVPQKGAADLSPRQPAGVYEWGPHPDTVYTPEPAGAASFSPPPPPAPPNTSSAAAVAGALLAAGGTPLLPTMGGLYIALSRAEAPAIVDIPDMAAVRSLAVRFQPGPFRVAASRPLVLDPGGSPMALRLVLSGEPLDLVLTVPEDAAFDLRAEGRRLVQSSGGRPTTSCTGVGIHEPGPRQVWFSFHPQAGRGLCR